MIGVMIASVRKTVAYFYQHWFVRNMFTLQAGSFIGTFVQGLGGVLLVRILQPELYGVYVLAFGVAGLASLFLGAGVQEASTVLLSESYAKGERERMQEMLAFLVKMSLWGAVLGLLFALAAPALTSYWYDDPMIGWYGALIVIASVVSSLWFSFVVVSSQIAGEIRSMAMLTMTDQVLRMTLSVILALAGFGVFGAVMGHLVGSLIVFFVSMKIWQSLRRRYNMFPSLGVLSGLVKRVSIRKYFSFSFWITVDRNLATLYAVVPVLLTGFFVSTSEVTFFKLAFGYVNIALSFLGPVSTLLNVEFPKMKVENRDHLADNFSRVTGYGIVLSTLLTAAAVVISPLAFRILYGPSAEASVPYIFGLFAYGALFGLGIALGPMWRALNRVKVSITINVLTLTIGLPLGLLFLKFWHLWGAVILVTVWYTVSHLVSFLYLARRLRSY